MKKFIVLILVTFMSKSINAQAVNWFNPNSGFNNRVYSLFASPTYNKLFVGGAFTYCNGLPSEAIAAYDSVNWTAYGVTGCNAYYSIVEYQGNVYAAGSGGRINKWDGVSWTNFVTLTQGAVNSMETYNNELYVVGIFDTIAGVPAKNVAKWDGTNWYSLGFSADYIIYSVLHYNGDLFVGGDLYDTLGNDVDIARYNGVQWDIPGGGIHGADAFVSCMAIYNGELYVAGKFIQLAGNFGDKIQKWDGTSWSDVGGGLGYSLDQVNALKVFNGELYAGGFFIQAGGIFPVRFFAKWNGQQWCSLGSHIQNPITALEVFKGELYIGGDFLTIDGDSINRIAKWIGGNYVDTCSAPQGINELANDVIGIYPNPVSENLTIEISNSEKKYLSIYNVLGEEILTQNFSSQKYSVNASGLARGIYIAEVSSGKNIMRKKFTKE